MLQYLNDGIGTPCAGHVSAIPNPNFFLNAEESRIVENFGFESPIGSKDYVKTKNRNCKLIFFQYLNDGIGIPCAGQVKATPEPNFFLKADKSTLEENFGFENPMGSKQINVRNNRKTLAVEKHYLNAGMGIPWAGQVRAMPSPCFFSKADRDNMDENFGLDRPIGSKKGRKYQFKIGKFKT